MTEHIGGLNAHEHTSECNGNYTSDVSMSLPAGDYNFSIAGAQGGWDASAGPEAGSTFSGVLHLKDAATVRIVVGQQGGSNCSGGGGGYPDGCSAGAGGSSGAGAIVSYHPASEVAEFLPGHPAMVGTTVEAAEATTTDAVAADGLPWSTAYVYGLLPIDLSTGGQAVIPDGFLIIYVV